MRRQLSAVIAGLLVGCSHPAATTDVPVEAYVAGQTYFGANGYIEYIAGNAPVIFTAPHGGTLQPASIPDRTADRCGGSATTTTDLSTADLARAMQRRYFARFGTYPHVVIANIARRKLDANRTPPEATCGNAEAEAALREWHAFIDVAKRAVLQKTGKGWYMDMHGHGHAIQRLELGYLIDSAQLSLTDAQLNAQPAYADASSIRTIARASTVPFAQILRGPGSLGTLYANNGFPSVPSAAMPNAGGAAYFSGGDDTRRHACGAEASALGGVAGGMICGVQIESHFTGVRDTPANRDRFGDVTAIVLEQFLVTFWGLSLSAR